MKHDGREIAAALAPAALLALIAALAGVALAATLEAPQRQALAAMLEPRAALLLLGWLVVSLGLGVLARRAYRRWVRAPAQLAEEAAALLHGGTARELAAPGDATQRALAKTISAFAAERAALRADVERQVAEGARGVEQERSRLAALMAELTQSVVVCNLDGRILLYNNRARFQFRALSAAPLAGGAELIGLGRSIYAVFDRQLVAHALERIQQRLQRGAAHPSAQFVTGTRAGQLLRVQMAPVRAIDGAQEAPLNGFVLMLDNITRDFTQESAREAQWHALIESSRAALGNLQAAVEMLDYPDVDAASRERFHGVIRDEVQRMSSRVQAFALRSAEALKSRWPLEDMLGADLVAAARARIEALHGCRTGESEVDATLWLQVDSWSLLQALAHLAGRLVQEYGVKLIQLRLARAGTRAQLDLAWRGAPMSTETVVGWETEPMRFEGESVALTLRDIVERHDGAFWFERGRAHQDAVFRFLLPLADADAPPDAAQLVRSESRPEFYDFDLFRSTEPSRELAERRLADLACTVFDTETTGLDPSAGDRILQIGAARIVGGKLRRGETFEQLVDPQCEISAASIAIHAITPEMVAGQPVLAEVLPAFHAFAADTVLVAHNAAFDMRFLQRAEAETGVVFNQPVLDTLLLSALVHPNAESHGLESIAGRLGVPVLGRHTALGDAIVTAEVFLRLVPLLAERGIHTLGQAQAAAQQTWYARVNY